MSEKQRGGASPLSRYSKVFKTSQDKAYNFYVCDYSARKGFTLAEVLITLGIIGIVSALTIPTVSHNIQQAVLKNQFKNFYSTFLQAVLSIQTREGRQINCYYWVPGDSPYTDKCTATCSDEDKNEYGVCTRYFCEETGKPLPSDLNGNMSDCSNFHAELFLKTVKTVKICKDHAYNNSCLPNNFRGVDKVKAEKDPGNEYDPNGIFGDNVVKNEYPVYILADGVYIIGFSKYLGKTPLYTVDINGHKGPNKWGYDIFTFKLIGNSKDGIKGLNGSNQVKDEGGKWFDEMYKEAFGR